jgi:ABC-type polysaccharide/polyol phosphate export permease
MIEEYLRQIDELFSINPAVREVEIVRRSVQDTDFEKVLNYCYCIILADGSFVEMTEWVLDVHRTLEVTKYRHH